VIVLALLFIIGQVSSHSAFISWVKTTYALLRVHSQFSLVIPQQYYCGRCTCRFLYTSIHFDLFYFAILQQPLRISHSSEALTAFQSFIFHFCCCLIAPSASSLLDRICVLLLYVSASYEAVKLHMQFQFCFNCFTHLLSSIKSQFVHT
jgi:hypothetical protein